MHAVQPKAPVVGRVVFSQPCLSGRSAIFVRHICIDVSGTPLAGSFRVGQAFGVVAPGEDDRGRPHAVRLYSLACPSWGEDGEGAVISTTVKRVIDEFTPDSEQDDPDAHHLFLVCSNYLCDLKVGIRCSSPVRRPEVPALQDPDGHDYLFIATERARAVLRHGPRTAAAPRRPDRRVDLIAGLLLDDLIYDRFFSDLAEACPNFNYHHDQPQRRTGEYVDRYLERNLDQVDLLEGERTLVYMRGRMQSGVYRMPGAARSARGYMEMRIRSRSRTTSSGTIAT